MRRAGVNQPIGDPFPSGVEIRRARRRSVELSLRQGKLIASVPHRMPQSAVEEVIPSLRSELWERWRRDQVLDDEDLGRCAERARKRWLKGLQLPPYTVRFAGRMQRRWASCTSQGDAPGSIRVSRNLRGHPRWLLEHILHHELIHLRIPNHGEQFQEFLARSPHGDRAGGYLEALEHGHQWGELSIRVATESPENEKGQLSLPLLEDKII